MYPIIGYLYYCNVSSNIIRNPRLALSVCRSISCWQAGRQAAAAAAFIQMYDRVSGLDSRGVGQVVGLLAYRSHYSTGLTRPACLTDKNS